MSSPLAAVLASEAAAQSLSGRELSRLSGLTERTVRRTLSGSHSPRADGLLLLLAALGRDLTWLDASGVRPLNDKKGDT